MSLHEQVPDMVKAAPPLTVTGMSLAGYSMSDWVFALTAIYTALQIIILIRRWLRPGNAPSCAVNDCPARKR
jgi:hypothetical protein